MHTLPDGFLAIDKPAGLTSHDVVDAVRAYTGERRVGHAGTLDPFATGLLIVAVGAQNTKRLREFQTLPKTYEAEAVLGKISSTGDPEGIIQDTPCARQVTHSSIARVLEQFTGEHLQTPPMYSAKKIRGKKLYELARAGTTVPRAPVPVRIYSLELLAYTYPVLSLRVTCGAGTYIRTLVEDIGSALGTGAYTHRLRRTRIGNYRVEEATPLCNFS